MPAEDDKLGKYRGKRDAGTSPEPTGEELPPGVAHATRTGAFVVHLHAATRTHYDLRLEVGGVLASFAVPKGPGLDPSEKQLAIQTEEHPIEYVDFEAVIPEGNYGAGPMICWDRGMVRYLETTAEQGLATGKLDFTLSGYKLRGRFALVKLDHGGASRRAGDGHGKGNEWLLIKKSDAFARADEDVRATQPRSVLSGLTVEELEKAPLMASQAEELAHELGAPRGELDGRALSPMLCSSLEDRGGDQPTSLLPAWLKQGYTYELKLDGVRVIAEKRDGEVHLTYRSNRDTTLAYPEVERAVQALAPERVVLDGEIVAFDDKGVPNFQRLSQRIHLSDDRKNKASFGGGSVGWAVLAVPVVYLVFDILAIGPYDVSKLPLVCRRDLLRRVVLGSGVLRALDYLETGGDALLDFCRARHLEGIVCKRADSPYRQGPKRTPDWVKVKCERDESFVVIGHTRGNEGRSRLGALDLAAYDEDGQLVVRGKVGSGLDEKTIDMLLEKLEPLVTKERMFGGKLDSAPNGRTLVKPQIVVSVRFLGWSDEGRLRFPTFRGVDYDRAPTDCVAGPHGNAVHLPSLEAPRFRKEAEQREEAARAHGEAPPDSSGPPSSGPTSWRSSHPLKRATLTNQTKVFWPPSEGGYTKGDICRYYESVSTVLLPYLRDRPVILVRYPDGIHGKSFFQWNVPFGFPAWIRHIPLGDSEDDKKKRVFLINDLDSLLTVANLGAIPLHILACRAGSLDQCDFCTIDFDVDRSTLKNGVTLALELRRLLDEIGLRGYPKTSGQHGLHVLVPLGPGVSFETAQALNVLLGRLVAARHPDIATLERVIARRGDKVLVDIGQTGRRRSIVSPYSVRAHPGATVSTPLEWAEVNDELDPSKLDIRTLPERIARIGMDNDPMRGVLEDAPDVGAAVQRLEAIVSGSST
jgi:bifunctional non-homologous end joining protein LigD